MKEDEAYYSDPIRDEAVKAYFDSLNKEDIIFNDSAELFEACKILVAEKFITEEEDRYAYLEHVKELYCLMTGAQSWHTPPERNDVPLKIISED